MRNREKEAAVYCGCLERCQALEKRLLEIPGVAYDDTQNGIFIEPDGLGQVIIMWKYDIDPADGEYFQRRKKMMQNVIMACSEFDLYPSGDRIEDYGEHCYMVRRCGRSWKNEDK